MVQVRNLCYMVSRREKLKLLQSKAQEQMFNLHVTLVNQELSAGESFIDPSEYLSELRLKPLPPLRSAALVPHGEHVVPPSSQNNPEAENAQILKCWKRKPCFQIW